MTESFLSIMQQYQLGTVPGWGLLVTALLFWWKGLPSLIIAWEKRSEGIESRLQASMAATVERFESQLADADKQHARCMEDQEKLRVRLGQQDVIIATQNETIARQSANIVSLTEQVNALKTSNMQQQIAIAESGPYSQEMHRALGVLKEVK